jgi:gliding motility-associated-like protein
VGNCYINNGYQWQTSTDGTAWTNIPGATGMGYTPALSVIGTYYFRLNVAENGNTGNTNCSANSNVITVLYRPYVAPVVSNISAAICPADPYLLPSGKTADSTGMYSDTLYNAQGCPGTITNLNLTVYDQPSLGPDKNICAGDTAVLNPGTFDSYLWQDGSTLPTYAATKAGVYWVKVTYDSGCTASDTVVVKFNGCLPAKIPNTFTPNGDGINDTWEIDGLQGYAGCTVFIYNRWGQQVFASTGYSKPWDGTYEGKNLPFGTYYYVIDLKNNSPRLSGYVTIVR